MKTKREFQKVFRQLENLEFEAVRLLRDLRVLGEMLPDAAESVRSDYIHILQIEFNKYFQSIQRTTNKRRG